MNSLPLRTIPGSSTGKCFQHRACLGVPRQGHSKHCSATYSAGQPRSSTVPALSPQQSKQRAPQPGTGRSMGLYLQRIPGTPSHAAAAQWPCKTSPQHSWRATQPSPFCGTQRRTSIFPEEQRPASLLAPQDSNQLIQAATRAATLGYRHL